MRLYSNIPSAADTGQTGHKGNAPCEWPHDSPFYGLKIQPRIYRMELDTEGEWMQAFVIHICACLACDLTLWISGAGHWPLDGWQSSLGLQLLSHQAQRCPWSSRPQHWEQSELSTLQLYTSTRGKQEVGEKKRGNYYCNVRLLNSIFLVWLTPMVFLLVFL